MSKFRDVTKNELFTEPYTSERKQANTIYHNHTNHARTRLKWLMVNHLLL